MRKMIQEVIQRWAVKGVETGDFDMDELEESLMELWKQTLTNLGHKI